MNFCRFSCFIAGYSKSSLKISDSGLDRFNCSMTFLNYMYSLQRSVENISYSLNKPRIFLLISFCRCTCPKGKHCDIVNFYFLFFFVDVNVQFTLSYCEFYIYTRAVNSNLQYENILYQFFVHKVLSIFMRACVREIHSNVYDSVFKIKEIILKITDYAFGNQMYFLYQTFYCQTYNAKKRVEKLEKTYFALSLNFIEIHQYIPYICSSVFNR